jgi:hypothetical protein
MRLKALSGAISRPLLSAANTATPRSIPTGGNVDGAGFDTRLRHATLAYQWPALRRMVMDRNSPPSGRRPRSFTHPAFGIRTAP